MVVPVNWQRLVTLEDYNHNDPHHNPHHDSHHDLPSDPHQNPHFRDFAPDIVLVSAGFDAGVGHEHPIGGYKVNIIAKYDINE